MFKFQYLKLGILLLLLIGITACSKKDEALQEKHNPVAIESGEECHLCGMVILSFPGPKGELYDRGGTVRKFCSTRDLFSWYLQPENQNSTQEIFVHNMVRTPWDKPDDHHLVSARKAWYVSGSNMKGAMGSTLASFEQQVDATTFISKQGGRLLQFKDITLELMTAINRESIENMPDEMDIPI